MTVPDSSAIVGSEDIGSALGWLFTRADIEVSIANTRGSETVRELAASIGPGVHAVSLAEVLGSNVILMAIPFAAVEQFGTSQPD